MKKRILALGLAGVMVIGTLGTAHAFDTRMKSQELQLNALIRCPDGHGRATVVMWRGFHETGGSLVEFRLTGGQTHRACG